MKEINLQKLCVYLLDKIAAEKLNILDSKDHLRSLASGALEAYENIWSWVVENSKEIKCEKKI